MEASPKRIHVAVAVIRHKSADDGEKILISKRANDAHQGGLWEFPGGKVEQQETVQDALRRELEEELDIRVGEDIEPLIRIRHDYTDKQVLLDVWQVFSFEGEPHGNEGQPIEWVALESLTDYAFPAANEPIIDALSLPRRYLITPEFEDYQELQGYLLRASQQGFSLLQLRQHQLDAETYQTWAVTLYQALEDSTATIVLNRPLVELEAIHQEMASRFGEGVHERTGWHLSARTLSEAYSQRKKLTIPRRSGASCHNADELRLAVKLKLQYALLSPIEATATHPGKSGIGFPAFARLVEPVAIPVYALGGLGENQLDQAISSGAQGVAAIRAWQKKIDQELIAQ